MRIRAVISLGQLLSALLPLLQHGLTSGHRSPRPGAPSALTSGLFLTIPPSLLALCCPL